jgi:hypothetical protein
VLAVGAPSDRHIGAALGEIGHRRECLPDQAQENPVHLAQHQEIAGLCDVLRRRTPMHPATKRLARDPAQLPNQRHDCVAGTREPLVDARPVEQIEMSRMRDCIGRALRNYAELLLRLGESRLDIEPSLPAVFQAIQRADARIGYAGGGREFVTHGCSSVNLGSPFRRTGRRHAANTVF